MIKVFTFNLPGDVTIEVALERPDSDPKSSHSLSFSISDHEDAISTESTPVNYSMAHWLSEALSRAESAGSQDS